MSVGRRFERLCKALGEDDFADLARKAGAEAAVAGIVATVKSGDASPDELLDQLDALDEAFTQVGVDGLTTSTRVFRPQSFDAGHPVVEALVCPLDRCSRVEAVPGPEERDPRCPILDMPLERTRMRL